MPVTAPPRTASPALSVPEQNPLVPTRPSPASQVARTASVSPGPTLLVALQEANQFSCFGENDFLDFSTEQNETVLPCAPLNLSNYSKAGEAIATGGAYRAILYPLDLVTTRLMLGHSPKGNYFRGLGTNIATGAIGKAASLGSNKAVRDALETNNITGSTLAGGIAAGGIETALNPLAVIAQQAKMLPKEELVPALKKMPLKSYYNGGGALLVQNVLGAGIWYHGNALVRNPEDSLAVEAGKSAAVCTASSVATWPVRLMRVQRIGVNDVSPSYREIIGNAMKEGLVKGLKLNAFFPTGLARVLISGAILGPLMNRFNESK